MFEDKRSITGMNSYYSDVVLCTQLTMTMCQSERQIQQTINRLLYVSFFSFCIIFFAFFFAHFPSDVVLEARI